MPAAPRWALGQVPLSASRRGARGAHLLETPLSVLGASGQERGCRRHGHLVVSFLRSPPFPPPYPTAPAPGHTAGFRVGRPEAFRRGRPAPSSPRSAFPKSSPTHDKIQPLRFGSRGRCETEPPRRRPHGGPRAPSPSSSPRLLPPTGSPRPRICAFFVPDTDPFRQELSFPASGPAATLLPETLVIGRLWLSRDRLDGVRRVGFAVPSGSPLPPQDGARPAPEGDAAPGPAVGRPPAST